MTISFRNKLFGTAFFLTLICAIGFSVCVFFLVSRNISFSLFDSLPIGPYFSSKKPFLPAHIVVLVRTGIMLAFSVILTGTVLRYFRKTSSPEVFFFMAFLASISFESFRIVQPFLVAANLPPDIGTVPTRIVYFARYFGIFSLFAAGLYPVGFTYEKLGRILFFVSLAALAISGGMPVDSSTLGAGFLHAPGYGAAQSTLAVSFGVLASGNFFLAGVLKSSASHYKMGTAVALVLMGREMSFFFLDPAIIVAGLLFYGFGGFLFIKTTRAYYLWS
jgi:hypothetical protein